MSTSLSELIHEAIKYRATAFDRGGDISGADLVEWFADWRRRARAVLRPERVVSTNALASDRFRSQLIGALQTLQLMQDRADVEAPLMNHDGVQRGRYASTDSEIDRLVHALRNGGIRITVGSLVVMVFKRSDKESPCQGH